MFFYFPFPSNNLNALREQDNKLTSRISRLYDMKLDGEINEDIFKTKESEYQLQLLGIESQMNQSKINPNAYDDACQIFELCNRLYPLHLRANFEEKANIVRLIFSSYTRSDLNLVPIYKKPFSILAKGLFRSSWLPELVDINNIYSFNKYGIFVFICK